MTELLAVEKSLNDECRMKNEELRMVRQHDIYNRVFDFAMRVLRMERVLSRSKGTNRNALNQLVRAATSIGANLEEANASHTKTDFHSKLRISLKEAREAYYWLRLIAAVGTIAPAKLASLVDEANQIVAILTTIAKRANPRNPS
jgi:four helix bundle protein